MILSSEQKKLIQNHANLEYPKECCGFVLPNGIYECQNKSSQPLKNFSISPIDYLKAKDLGAWAVYHSHPDGSNDVSSADKFFQDSYRMSLIVYSNLTKKFNVVSCDGTSYVSSLENKTECDLTQYQKNKIKNHCIEKYPEEACGIGLNGGAIIICENQSEDKNNFFSIHKEVSDKFKGQIDFVFHSHCKDKFATFSDADEQASIKTKTPYVLYNVLTDEFKKFEPKGDLPYEGRVLIPGFIDCSSLAQDYYKKELNIDLPTMNHPFRFHRFNKTFVKMCKEYWEKNDSRVLLDFYLEKGFVEVDSPRLHDLIISNSFSFVSNVFTHISVYLDSNRVLDYGDKGLSGVYSMTDFLSKSFGEVKFLRHKDLA
jgi:proteasome lid subunit RPN8/RPN11